MDTETLIAKGRKTFKQFYGDVLPVPEQLSPYAAYTLSTLFAEVLSRTKLPMRDKRLLILGAIAGLGAEPSLFEIHTRSALQAKEISKDELEEICLILVNYCGHPRVSPLFTICRKLINEANAKN